MQGGRQGPRQCRAAPGAGRLTSAPHATAPQLPLISDQRWVQPSPHSKRRAIQERALAIARQAGSALFGSGEDSKSDRDLQAWLSALPPHRPPCRLSDSADTRRVVLGGGAGGPVPLVEAGGHHLPRTRAHYPEHVRQASMQGRWSSCAAVVRLYSADQNLTSTPMPHMPAGFGHNGRHHAVPWEPHCFCQLLPAHHFSPGHAAAAAGCVAPQAACRRGEAGSIVDGLDRQDCK